MANFEEGVPFQILAIDENSKEENEAKSPWSLVRVGPTGWILLDRFREFAKELYHLPVESDHVWVMGFPRSGTTMMQELVWLIHNDVDFEAAKIPINDRVNFIDGRFLRAPTPPQDYKSKSAEETKISSKNVIKTHLAFDVLPPTLLEKCKVIFVARNPKDAAVSFFHFKPSTDNFELFWKQFMADKVVYGPFFKYILHAWDKRQDPNMLFLFYEDTQKDLRSTILRVAKHLEKKLSSVQVESLIKHLDINAFKSNKAVNHEYLKTSGDIKCDFVRKGGVGGWRDHFTDEMSAQADSWIKGQTEGTEFSFPDN